MDTVQLGVRRKCLFPATGKKMAVLSSGASLYYYFLYRNAARDLYLAYSPDGNTWDATKLLILAASSTTVALSASLAVDLTNMKLYVVYHEVGTASEIKAVAIDCTVPTAPSLGTPVIVTGYSTNYEMPYVALGYDGGLHVVALRMNFGGNRVNIYSVKSAISGGQPNLAGAWSSLYTVGNNNHATNYAPVGIYAHPDINRLVILWGRWSPASMYLYRSLNTTGAYDAWMAGASSNTTAMYPTSGYFTEGYYNTAYATSIFDMAIYPGLGNASFAWGWANNPYGYWAIYDFDGDTGVGLMSLSSITSFTGGLGNYCTCVIKYPGDYHFHLFTRDIDGFTYYVDHRSYSLSDAYVMPAQHINTSLKDEDRSFTAPYIYPSITLPANIRAGFLLETP